MLKYRYTCENFEKILKDYFFIYKASVFLCVYSKNSESDINKNSLLNRGFIERTFTNLKLKESEFLDYLRKEEFHDISSILIKFYFEKFRELSQTYFKTILKPLSNNPENTNISFESFVKIYYYLIDLKSEKSEFIDFLSDV